VSLTMGRFLPLPELEKLASFQRSSLFCRNINVSEKKFYSIGARLFIHIQMIPNQSVIHVLAVLTLGNNKLACYDNTTSCIAVNKRDTKPNGSVMLSVTKNILYKLCHYAGYRYAECPVPVKY
jgi:hypothetical protein